MKPLFAILCALGGPCTSISAAELKLPTDSAPAAEVAMTRGVLDENFSVDPNTISDVRLLPGPEHP